jgi:diaminopimelate epimerase
MPQALSFSKYHGAGNDFILLDNRENRFGPLLRPEWVARLCQRRFGIGADGLMALERAPDAHFAMRYYNADGREGSFCGNGGRCIVAFARQLGLLEGLEDGIRFRAVDGCHQAVWTSPNRVALKMQDVDGPRREPEGYVLQTGSPHLVVPVEDVETFALEEEGPRWRWAEKYAPSGINVNVMALRPQGAETQACELDIRTFERGVEAETWACGTGAVAAALAAEALQSRERPHFRWTVHARGGTLSVEAQTDGRRFHAIWLTGPADFVFDGHCPAL